MHKCGGTYKHFGIKCGIIQRLANFNYQKLKKIKLKVNVDGVQLFKSSATQFWPILGIFENLQPFIIALFCGSAKPDSVEDYLRNFINEMQLLKSEGIFYNDKFLSFELMAFICDAPAWQFLKCVKSHNGYFGCERCVTKGIYKHKRMLFSECYCTLRLDENFNA
ncbi:uncharacterized protein LOC136095129 [Hydra vulgaris]|uniref:uncharacterized protein LOC136095129 n=1 Tax=Hydra vulgaris TaxID=6087 RepID=UPI0032E9FB4A